MDANDEERERVAASVVTRLPCLLVDCSSFSVQKIWLIFLWTDCCCWTCTGMRTD
jgi:hypothetical protein